MVPTPLKVNVLAVLALLLMPYQQTTPTKADSVEMILPQLNTFQQMDTMRWLAKQYRFTDTRKSIKLCNDALAMARKEVEYNPAKIYMELGIDHTIISENSKAAKYYDSAILLAKDQNLIGSIYNNKAILATFTQNFDQALEFHFKSLDIHEELKNDDGIMRSYAGISWVYKSTREYEKALEYERKSYDLATKLKDEPSQYTVLGNMAGTLLIMNRNKEAKDINLRVIRYMEKTSPGSVPFGNNLYNMAKIYGQLSNWDSAYYYSEKANKIFKDIGAQRELGYTLSMSARAAMGLGKMKEAEADALESYRLNKEQEREDDLEYSLFMLVKIYAYKHDVEHMDQFERELAAVTDTIRNRAQAKAVAEITTRYETAKKDHENELLRHEAELKDVKLSRSRYIGFSSLVGAGLLAMVAITLYQKNKQRKRFNKVLQTENEKLKYEMLVAQLNQLKDQINPHFLFNSLATLQSMAQEQDPNTGLFVQKLSEVYRYILQTNSDSLVTLQEELKVAEAYMFMLEARFEKALITSITISDDLLSKKLPPFSLQLLIENATKHNAASLSNPLRIEITVENNEVIVRNNLQKKRSAVDSTKVGLANLQRRFFLLGEKEISIDNDSTHFTVRLPLYE